jgi:hypothetical protein
MTLTITLSFRPWFLWTLHDPNPQATPGTGRISRRMTLKGWLHSFRRPVPSTTNFNGSLRTPVGNIHLILLLISDLKKVANIIE